KFFSHWGEYRQLIRELNSYSDAELAELGVVRSACARIAFDAAFNAPLEDLRRWLKRLGARPRHGSTARILDGTNRPEPGLDVLLVDQLAGIGRRDASSDFADEPLLRRHVLPFGLLRQR